MRAGLRGALARRRHRRRLARMAGPRLLSAFADAYPAAFFVEIGANDGRDFDHLHPFVARGGWRGIMVEPVPHVFARLQANVGHLDGVALENAAIAESAGRRPFFHLREATGTERARLPDYYDALGSFSRDAVLAHRPQIPDVEERLVVTEVPTLTFDGLLAKHGARQADLVAIDTEGYDCEILRAIDLDRHRPRLIVYEHFHLDDAERAACRELVRRAGYATLEEGFDTFCLRDAAAGDPLAGRWAGLAPAVPAVTKHDEAP